MGIGLSRLAAVFTLAATFVAAPADAMMSLEKGDYSLEVIGAGRLTGAYYHFFQDEPLLGVADEGISTAVGRLIADGTLGSLVDYDLNVFMDMVRAPTTEVGGRGTFATAGSYRSPYRYPALTWTYWDGEKVQGRIGIDRLSFDFNGDKVSASIGRMPLTYTVTYIFAINDFFAPFATTAVNTIYKPGVDAARISFETGTLSNIDIVGVLGSNADDEVTWGQSALMAHGRTVLWNIEWALLGGKLAERWVVGASVQGELGPVGIRSEGHVGFPDADGGTNDDIYTRLAAGVDKMFVWRNANVSLEYMFRSDGAATPDGYEDAADALFPDDLPYLGRHYLGLTLGGDIMPILRLQAMSLVNVQDLSGLASLSLIYSISDEADAMLGLIGYWGEEATFTFDGTDLQLDDGSEFGSGPLTTYLETRFYF